MTVLKAQVIVLMERHIRPLERRDQLLEHVLYRGSANGLAFADRQSSIKTMATQMFSRSPTSEAVIFESHTVTR